MTTTSATEGREMVEWDWLFTRTGHALHHATLDEAGYRDIANWSQLGVGEPGEQMPRWVTLTCGIRVTYVGVPPLGARMDAERCFRCCRRLGYPWGIGSPKNDDLCRGHVTARIRRAT